MFAAANLILKVKFWAGGPQKFRSCHLQLQKFDKAQLVPSSHPQLPAGAQLQLLRSSLRATFDWRAPAIRVCGEHMFGTFVRKSYELDTSNC